MLYAMASGSQKIQSAKFQPPKGTRDFYPQDMAVRRYIESVWRKVSINHGFDEVEGPMFEHLDLYTHKSGPGIVSEIFQVFSGKDEAEVAQIRAGKSAPYALRPEFTPTLARMVASEAASLPRPIKWFAIPQHFRAESPQRGRLREFGQWNVDFVGGDSLEVMNRANADVIACAVSALIELGLGPESVTIRLSHKCAIQELLSALEIDNPVLQLRAIDLIDAIPKRSERQQIDSAIEAGLTPEAWGYIKTALAYPLELHRDDYTGSLRESIEGSLNIDGKRYEWHNIFKDLISVLEELDFRGFGNWCVVDPQIVRGLAYYTGMVFEIHEATGAERAIAGGGRYDKLIESFGGPSLPACGFGMGDVVLGNILRDKGLLKDEIIYEPIRPDAFVISNGEEIAEAQLPQLVASLRRDGLHVRHSYKSTRNVGKLLGDAGKARARFAVILGKELNEQPPRIALKHLDSGEQREIAISDLSTALKRDV